MLEYGVPGNDFELLFGLLIIFAVALAIPFISLLVMKISFALAGRRFPFSNIDNGCEVLFLSNKSLSLLIVFYSGTLFFVSFILFLLIPIIKTGTNLYEFFVFISMCIIGYVYLAHYIRACRLVMVSIDSVYVSNLFCPFSTLQIGRSSVLSVKDVGRFLSTVSIVLQTSKGPNEIVVAAEKSFLKLKSSLNVQ